MTHDLGTVFDGAYLLGCVAAVRWVRVGSLFAPMAQPPLILATVSALGASGPSGGGLSAHVLAAGSSVASHFAIEAVATAVTLLCGGLRLVLHHGSRHRTATS